MGTLFQLQSIKTTSVMIAHLHSVPGRVRVHVPEVKGDAVRARAVEAEFSKFPGVSRVDGRELTGSVVIHYDPRATNCDLLFASMGVKPSSAAFVRPPRATTAKIPAKVSGKIAEALIWHLIEKALERAVPLVLAAIL